MDRTEFIFALIGIATGLLLAPAGLPETLEKMFFAGVVLLMVLWSASVFFVLRRLKTYHPKTYSDIGATNEDLSWGIGDAFRRFKDFIHSSRHRDLGDDLLSTVVVIGRVTWRLSFVPAGFLLVLAVRSLAG
jgi:hypothetical protein